MENSDKIRLWKGKKVYIKLKNTTRCYSGIVLDETLDSVTIRDIANHLVTITKSEIALLQEEK